MSYHQIRPEEASACQGMLRYWSGLDPQRLAAKPRNSHEIFSVFAKANGCSFEEALDKAALALLAEWREANHDAVDEKN